MTLSSVLPAPLALALPLFPPLKGLPVFVTGGVLLLPWLVLLYLVLLLDVAVACSKKYCRDRDKLKFCQPIKFDPT